MNLTRLDDEIDVLHYEGFAVRPVEEDAEADNTPEIELKPVKGKKKKK